MFSLRTANRNSPIARFESQSNRKPCDNKAMGHENDNKHTRFEYNASALNARVQQSNLAMPDIFHYIVYHQKH